MEALGTKFNVAAYAGTGAIDVVLEEGLVKLQHKEAKDFRYILKPGNRARFDKENYKLNVEEVNTGKLTSWKDGIINIYNQPLREVLKRLELRYNQEFTIDERLRDYHYTFTITNESLEEVIELMERITPVKATQENEIIYFKPEKIK